MRTVSIPFRPDPRLLRALFDVRSIVNKLIPQWRERRDESRFDATKRSYRELRAVYPHLGSKWSLIACNETSAALDSWDRMLRRARSVNPTWYNRMRFTYPRRVRLKASLHPEQYRLKGRILDITVHPSQHVQIDLSGIENPLYEKYLRASGSKFGLTVTDRYLLFHFHTPQQTDLMPESVGVDLNMPSLDYASSDGLFGAVDLRPIGRIQGAMSRKRVAIQRAVSKDLRHQRAVMRRYHQRERNRVTPLLHEAANTFLSTVGARNLVFEDLQGSVSDLVKKLGSADRRRQLTVWSHDRLRRIISYKARTHVVRVNPRGTSSECPRCGGRLAHPSWRRATCGNCQGDFHRDRMAAVAILSRGQMALWGAALPPNALNELLEAARWRPEDGAPTDPTSGPMKEDEAKAAISR
jgi:IS605 OrfB family transposase